MKKMSISTATFSVIQPDAQSAEGASVLPATSVASDTFTAGSPAAFDPLPATGGIGPDYALEGYTWPSTTITWSVAEYNYSQDISAGIQFEHALSSMTEQLVQQDFARWSAVSGLSFVEVPDSQSPAGAADIRIGFAAPPPPSSGFETLGLTTWNHIGSTFQPDVTIQLADPNVLPLVQQPGGALYYQNFDATFDQVASHEIGHAIGMAHSALSTALMYPTATTINPAISPDDVAGINAAYPAAAQTVAPLPTFAVTDTSVGASFTAVGSNYNGPVSYLHAQFIYDGLDAIDVSSALPNVFLHGGALDDALQVTSGQNVLDGGTGSNFLVGGSGTDTFFVDDRNAATDIWSTMAGFHQGDTATVWGVTQQNSNLSWVDNQGANGYTGLTLHATQADAPTASLTLPGYTTADLSNGRLSVQFGVDPVSGSNYMNILAQG